MRHLVSRKRIGKTVAHRKAMISNMLVSFFKNGAIGTTYAKARVVRKFLDRAITRAKQDTVHNRRQLSRLIKDPGVLNHIFTVVAPHYADRSGGYSRIVKCGRRCGDDARIVALELVDRESIFPTKVKAQNTKDAKRK